MTWKPKASLGAERISFYLPIFGKFNLSVDSLEVFAKEGIITPEFNFYASRLDAKTTERVRAALQKRFEVSPTAVYRMTKMPMGEDFLQQLGKAMYTHPGSNGLYAIRSALILAAADETEGLTMINFLRHFPTSEMQLNSNLILSLIKEFGTFLSYNDTTVEAIAQQAQSEITSQQQFNFAQMPDLKEPGDYAVDQKTISFEINQVRQTNLGFSANYGLKTDVYLPENLSKPAPLIVLSHGFTSDRSHFNYLAKHLASHGYIVLVPEHIGSNSQFKEDFLQGKLSIAVSPIEFFNRPLDIRYLLNELENHEEFQGLINWSQVGVLGHSFGGNTALVVSGAPLNSERIKQACREKIPTLNVSELLQCRASYLPPGSYDLRDPRINAVIAVNPVTSYILGPESMSQIAIPTMLLGGSDDIVTPFIEEQAHPFLWLTTDNKYLGVMVGGTHNSSSSPEGVAAMPDFLKGVRPDLAREYLKAMTLAFFEVHLRDKTDYQAYLSSAYVQHLSHEDIPLHMVTSLTAEQLELAYGKTPPSPPIPESLVALSPSRPKNVLTEIENTQTLKMAMRSDAAPFGYIDGQKDLWTGYCDDFADSLGQYLAQELNLTSAIKIVKLPSNLENRFELVEDELVHFECGPNTIRANTENTIFSDLFFASGSRFLVRDRNQIDLNNNLEGLQTGVLQETTTVEFIQETYPESELVYFGGEEGRTKGVTAVTNGNIDAFVSDTILLSGEIDQQNLLRENYQLIPDNPLTCDFYGLILPQNDPQWRNAVNSFLRTKQQRNVFEKWFGDYLPQALSDTDYCLNRRK
ncbi:alpha/beta hydrolase [Xenococcus sp. PCC 7305]|uniref:alpha/beta hydrolase n=1 Tax=Xenococcus sp. PCC 7305 TaxID=102125 RepID=UPI0002F3DE9B|nr:alpha/beta hydrolase [Xenococcus sp. PCC 7305]